MAAGSPHSSRKAVERAFRQFLAHRVPNGEFGEAATALLGRPNEIAATDRTMTMIAAAYLDRFLEKAIRRVFDATASDARKNWLFATESGGPLSGTWAKTRLACALGIISNEMVTDAETVLTVRNGFAHHPAEFSFDVPEVRDMCTHFHVLDDTPGAFGLPKPTDPRERFVIATAIICEELSAYQPRSSGAPSP